MNIPRKGFVSGEFLNFTAEMSNQSTRRVKGVKVQLVQDVTYHSTKKSLHNSKIICEAKGPSVEPGDSEVWTGNILKIPPLPPTRLANCRIIDVKYILKIEMDLAGPSINLRESVPIIIGSIPLRNNFQDILSLQANVHEVAGPSAPPQNLLFTDQTSFLQDAYPDLPPPAYAETILQDQFERFGMHGQGDGNGGFSSKENESSAQAQPSAPPNMETEGNFAPKYLTYAWK